MLKVNGLRKGYQSDLGNVTAVNGATFEVAKGEFFTLLGPSGCGKSTILRCIAGLELFDGGSIEMDGQVVASPPDFVGANKRPIGMVFQSYAIWPHMTVIENVMFPLRYRSQKRLTAAQRRAKGIEALKLVHLDHFADRPAPNLSGGQQQRVALARGLVAEPKVLLLDEPLSNLDARLREDMRFEIKELVTRLGITTMYVTHDQTEALTMSDRIAVMSQGEIRQIGSPKDIYLAAASPDVARVVGSVNVLKGTLIEVTAGRARVRTTNGVDILCTFTGSATRSEVDVMVRPELITVTGCRISDGDPAKRDNVLTAHVARVLFAGDHVDCYCETPDGPMRAKLPPDSPIAAGETVKLTFDAERCIGA